MKLSSSASASSSSQHWIVQFVLQVFKLCWAHLKKYTKAWPVDLEERAYVPIAGKISTFFGGMIVLLERSSQKSTKIMFSKSEILQ